MKRQILIGLILLSSILTLNAQWDGNDPLTTNSNVGIGTTQPTSLFSVGSNHGIKLSIGNQSWANTAIISTGWAPNFGDYTDLLVPGGGANTALIRLVYNGNVGIGTIQPTGGLSIGDNHGVKLSIGKFDWSYKEILTTGYIDDTYCDFTDIKAASHASNNTSRFRILKNGNVGIMTEYPVGGLSIGTNHGSKLTIGAPTWASQSIITTGYNNDVYDYVDINVPAYTANTALIRMTLNGNVGIGVIKPLYKLDVKGTIRACEIKVNLENGCDFVFKSNYKLMDLKELEVFVKTNQHLPEIAPEKDMIENGVNMKEMQMKLLQKIEELTLYTIEQNKKFEQQNKKIENLEQTIKAQNEKIATIESASK